VPHVLSPLRIAGATINQLRQLTQHRLRREQLRQIGEFLWAASLFKCWAPHAADAVRRDVSIRNQSIFQSNLVPPDRDIDIMEAVVVEEPLFGLQLEFGKKHFGSRQDEAAAVREAPE